MQENQVLVTDWIKGEIIEWNGHSGYVNFISHEYITMCIREYCKPEEVAKHAKNHMHQVCVLIFPHDWHKVIRKDNK